MQARITTVGIAVATVVAGWMATPAAQFPGGPGGGPGFGGQEFVLVARFDKDGDKRLNTEERKAAREYLATQGRRGGGGRMFGPGGGTQTFEKGPTVDRASVRSVPASVPFYDLNTVRTLFFDFAETDWESELMAFKETDVEVPATLTVDGKAYREVGVSFRGASSFSMVPEGGKHSINVSVDFANNDQTLYGYNSLNLLNSHEDPTHLRAVLYLQAARDFLPAAKANFVRVVINGEHWGIYSNVQQVNKTFLEEWYKTDKGTRWKVPGRPGGRGGLEYWGDDPSAYKQTFEIKTKDDPKAWAALVTLTRVLNETPADKLEAALTPILDIDETLRFLALDIALVNNDGYWTRASDYNIYLDASGKFHILPHDTNETFASGRGGGPGGNFRGGGPGGPAGPPPPGQPGGFGPGGPGFGPPPGGGRGGGRGMMMGGNATTDPLIGLDDTTKPLRSKLLAVPALREKYLGYVRQVATKWLDWNTLGPLVTKYQAAIREDVRTDTHKLDSFEEFTAGVERLKTFADTRRALLLGK